MTQLTFCIKNVTKAFIYKEKTMTLYDFHVHSNFSDGTLSPESLMERAFAEGITRIALTDHDNVGGLDIAEKKAVELGINFVKGIEISAQDADCPVIHMLGFYIKDYDALREVMAENAASLRARNSRIVNFLKENCNININMDDFYQSFRGSVGKGNLAQYMTNKGYTQSFRESEDLMRPFKAGSYGVDVKKAINAIHNAGGKAFLAHPNNLKKDDDTLLAKIKEFMSLGLDGIECFHSNHSEEQTNLYLKYANLLGLKVSGGSDFHGDFKPNVRLGLGKKDTPLIINDLISIDD